MILYIKMKWSFVFTCMLFYKSAHEPSGPSGSVGFCRVSRVEGKMSRVEGKMSRVKCRGFIKDVV